MHKPKRFTWSYTALTDFETCPRAYAAKRVYKTVQEPESEALRWGNEVHKALEDRLAEKRPLPDAMQEWEKYARVIESAAVGGRLEVEREMAITREIAPCGWFDNEVWARGKIDVALFRDNGATAIIKDWKTGGRIKTDETQLEVFALMLMAIDRRIERVFGQFIWLKHGKATPEHPTCVTRDMYMRKWRELFLRVKRMEDAWAHDIFPAMENGLCRAWCPVVDCPHNGRR